MMKKVLLIGLPYDKNLGDVLIHGVTERCVKAWAERNKVELGVESLDLCGRVGSQTWDGLLGLSALLRNLSLIGQLIFRSPKETVCAVFVGGGLLKFKDRKLSGAIEFVLKLLDFRNIPTMLSGVGIEGYCEQDKGCQRLKKALNLNAVKVITTRDDIETLRTRYLVRNDILTASVCDPACETSFFWPAKQFDGKILGLGLATETIFKKAGRNGSLECYYDFTEAIVGRFLEKGVDKIRIFANGLKEDQVVCEAFCKRFCAKFGKEMFEIVSNPTNVDELTEVLSSASAMVVTRLHSAIPAYSYNIPFRSYLWNAKQEYFCKRIGYEVGVVDMDNLASDPIDVANSLYKEMECSASVGYQDREFKRSFERPLCDFIAESLRT